MKEARASMERAGDRAGAEKLGKRMESMAAGLHRDPQLESVLQRRAPELALGMERGRSSAQELARSVSIGRDRDRGMRGEARYRPRPACSRQGLWQRSVARGLIDQDITPHVPVIDRTRQRNDFFTRDAFRYDRKANVYHCPNDKLLTYRGTVQASQVRAYRSRPADCAACALKPMCTTARWRAVTRLVTEDARTQVRALSGTEASIRARQRRKRIERVFGHLKCNLNLRSLKLRGREGAAEEFTMAAAAYNLQLLANRAAPA